MATNGPVQSTLVMLQKNGKLLLGMKKRGFGAGNWNGFGGKQHEGETLEEAAVRELQEECGVVVRPENLRKFAYKVFHSPKFDDVFVHTYTADIWEGEPVETEEMKPEWFEFTDIPFDSMWPDDRLWVPKFLAGETFHGEFWFDADGAVERFEFKPFETVDSSLKKR